MNTPHAMTNCIVDLSDRGLLKVSGDRAKELLQGQLTCHLEEITSSQTRLGAHCNPHGRIISFFRLFFYQNSYYLLMQRDLVPLALTALKKYAVFFKVALEDVSSQYRCIGHQGDQLDQFIQPIAQEIHALSSTQNTINIKIADQLYEIIGHLEQMDPLWQIVSNTIPVKPVDYWKSLMFTQGVPAIYPETTEKFLPHDLSLPQLNAISFSKGCYTGQEIIARMHYRGKIKNYLAQATVHSDTPPQLAQDIYNDHGTAGQVVDFCKTEYNSYQMLIVTNEEGPLYLDPLKTIHLIKKDT